MFISDNADIMADISSFGHSNVVNSRIALASHGPAAKSDYSVVLPHQVSYRKRKSFCIS